MAWYGWLSLAVSLLGCLWGARVIAWAAIKDVNGGRVNNIEGDDYAFGAFTGLVLCWIWPLLLLYRMVNRFTPGNDLGVLLVAPHSYRRHRQLEKAQRRIGDLERQVEQAEREKERALAL